MKEIISKLPPRLQLRFTGLSAWAKSLIESNETSWSRTQRTTTSQMRQIQSLFILILLDRFLRRGTQAAVDAVENFSALGVAGFSVGSTKFQGRNENVMRGEYLSDEIRRLVPLVKELSELLEKQSGAELALSLRELVRASNG